MQAKKVGADRRHQLREAYRREIGELGVFIEGTLSQVKRPGRKPRSWQLTFKQAGKTRTVYVPRALAPEVQLWTREFKRLKRLVRKVTQQNLAIIRRHAAVCLAERRAQRLTAKTLGGNSTR